MLQVDLENILTEEDALQKINDIFSHVENQKETYVVTSGGRPKVVIMSIDQLEKMGGMSSIPEPMPMAEAPAPMAPMPEPALPEMPTAPVMDLGTPPPAPAMPDFTAPMPEPAPQMAQAQPANVPPMTGSLDMPAAPEDPRNSSPLA